MGFDFEFECSLCYQSGRGERFTESKGFLCSECLGSYGEVRHRILSGIVKHDIRTNVECCFCGNLRMILFEVAMCQDCLSEEEEKEDKESLASDTKTLSIEKLPIVSLEISLPNPITVVAKSSQEEADFTTKIFQNCEYANVYSFF